MTTLSTHVLDSTLGLPATDLRVLLRGPGETHLVATRTDTDGRIRFDADLAAGTHVLHFETGLWFAAAGRETFYPEVTVAFEVDPAREHLHVALLLAAYSYTTYRGS